MLAAFVAGGALPAPTAALALVASWMLLLDLYARAAGTEREHRTAALVFSAASGGRNVLIARWAMLVLLGFAATLPALVRFALELPMAALALLAATLSLPTLALALGAVTRGPRLFEVLVCVGAYLALNRIAPLDVAADPAWTAGLHVALLLPAGRSPGSGSSAAEYVKHRRFVTDRGSRHWHHPVASCRQYLAYCQASNSIKILCGMFHV